MSLLIILYANIYWLNRDFIYCYAIKKTLHGESFF